MSQQNIDHRAEMVQNMVGGGTACSSILRVESFQNIDEFGSVGEPN